MAITFTGSRDATFNWIRNYLDFSDSTTLMRDADNCNREVTQPAPDAPMRPGYVHVRNNGGRGTYEARFEPRRTCSGGFDYAGHDCSTPPACP